MFIAIGNSTAHPTNHVNPPTRSEELLVVQIPLISFALFFVALRLASRYFAIVSPGWDDFVLVAATVLPSSQFRVGPDL